MNQAEFSTSEKFLKNLLNEHWSCFTGRGECETCLKIEKYIDEDLLSGRLALLEKMAMNVTSGEVLWKVLEAAKAYAEVAGTQARVIAISSFMMCNSAATEIEKSTILDPNWWLLQLCTEDEECRDGSGGSN